MRSVGNDGRHVDCSFFYTQCRAGQIRFRRLRRGQTALRHGRRGPLLVLLHGFPDYHYTWRDQMPALGKHFRVVALDLRGYNKSDKPEGVENYKLDKLVIHGLDDKYLLPGALNDTWKWVERDLTLVTVPGAGHFVHRDRPEWVTRKLVGWLTEP